LITILIGNNLFLELSGRLGHRLLEDSVRTPQLRAISVTLVLTPFILLFGEALPKEIFRLRPHSWTARTADFMMLSRIVYWPLQRLLRGLSWVLERALRISPERVQTLHAREVVLHMLAEGARSGALAPRAEALARNALELRTTPISTCMVPWEGVLLLQREEEDGMLRRIVLRSSHSRLPVVDAEGRCEGYVHQMDVLAGDPERPVLAEVLPLTSLPPSMPVDRALRTLRGTGRRMAIILEEGSVVPVGLITLKDLVEEISGELAGW
jgi:CBS domain containing-hemolysin-like protein